MTPGFPAGLAPLGPAASKLRRQLLSEIAAGRPGPGERLGAERDLAVRLGVSRSTLRATLDVLETEGDVYRVRGRAGGVFVSARRVERDLTSLTGLPAYLRRQGFQSGTRVLSTATQEADAETAAALGIPDGALVLEIIRVRLADDTPISLERARFPAERFPGLLDRSLSGSLYDVLMNEYRVRPAEAEEQIEVIGATAAEARVLEIRPGAAVVAVTRTAWMVEGAAFEFSRDLFRADRVRIIVRVTGTASAAIGSAVEVIGAD